MSTTHDYGVIATLLAEYQKVDMSDEELLKELEGVDIIDMFHALYFTELERLYYKKELKNLRAELQHVTNKYKGDTANMIKLNSEKLKKVGR